MVYKIVCVSQTPQGFGCPEPKRAGLDHPALEGCLNELAEGKVVMPSKL